MATQLTATERLRINRMLDNNAFRNANEWWRGYFNRVRELPEDMPMADIFVVERPAQDGLTVERDRVELLTDTELQSLDDTVDSDALEQWEIETNDLLTALTNNNNNL
jgi:hypothetical protein